MGVEEARKFERRYFTTAARSNTTFYGVTFRVHSQELQTSGMGRYPPPTSMHSLPDCSRGCISGKQARTAPGSAFWPGKFDASQTEMPKALQTSKLTGGVSPRRFARFANR